MADVGAAEDITGARTDVEILAVVAPQAKL